uniref:Uncharacterized protein n=1 Tax=Arundo donax TaxID=35708 RepID=A0A0A9F3C6_ARUDO
MMRKQILIRLKVRKPLKLSQAIVILLPKQLLTQIRLILRTRSLRHLQAAIQKQYAQNLIRHLEQACSKKEVLLLHLKYL